MEDSNQYRREEPVGTEPAQIGGVSIFPCGRALGSHCTGEMGRVAAGG